MPYIDGASGTSTKANVDANYNLLVNTTFTGVQAGFAAINVQTDSGVYTNSPLYRKIDASYDERTRLGVDTPIFTDRLAGTSVNTALYNTATAAMTVVQSGGFASLNANLNNGNGSYATMQTYRTFPSSPPFGGKTYISAQLYSNPFTGNITEMGFGLVNTNGAPSDGVFFRYSGTTLYTVVNNAGTEMISGTNVTIPSGTTHMYEIGWNGNMTEFRIDSNIVSIMSFTSGSSVGYDFPTAVNDLPIFVRTYNNASTTPSQSLKVSEIAVFSLDAAINKPWADVLAGMGGIASQGQTGNPMGSTALYTNSINPTQTFPTNTSAVLGSGLGGAFLLSGTIPIAATDYILCDYQVPTGTNTVPAKTLYIHGITVAATNLWGTASPQVTHGITVAYGHTAESLATTESASSKAPRFLPLGTISLPTGSAAGYTTSPLVFPFVAPIVVNPTEYISINSRFLAGTGLPANIQYQIGFDGYWE